MAIGGGSFVVKREFEFKDAFANVRPYFDLCKSAKSVDRFWPMTRQWIAKRLGKGSASYVSAPVTSVNSKL